VTIDAGAGEETFDPRVALGALVGGVAREEAIAEDEGDEAAAGLEETPGRVDFRRGFGPGVTDKFVSILRGAVAETSS
jgi:hypothetical protein